MAGSPKELKTIYRKLFAIPNDGALRSLRDALFQYHREDGHDTRAAADAILTQLNDGRDPKLSELQLSSLKRLMDWREFEKITPIKVGSSEPSPALTFYESCMNDPDFPTRLEEIRTLVFEYHVYASDQNRVDAIRKLRALAPNVDWNTEELDGFRYFFSKDARNKSLAPYPLPGDLW